MLRPDVGSELVRLVALGTWMGRQVEWYKRLSDPRRRHGRLDLHIRLRRPAILHPVRSGLHPVVTSGGAGGRHTHARGASNRGLVGLADRRARTDGQPRGVGAVAITETRCRADIDGTADEAVEPDGTGTLARRGP